MSLAFLPALPPAPPVLLLPAHTFLMLPPASREAAQLYMYHTIPLWLRSEQHNGVWCKLVVSYADPVSPGQRAQRGKLVLTERYTPFSSAPLPVAEAIPPSVVQNTLDKVMPTTFLPRLFALRPNLKSSDLPFSLLGPFAYYRLCETDKVSKDYQADRDNAFARMLSLWGDRPLSNITPEFCGVDLLDMSSSAAKDCVRLLRKLFGLEFGILMPCPDIWEQYSLAEFRAQYAPQRTVRSNLLNLPWSPAEREIAIQRCLNGIFDPKYGAY